MTLSPTLSPIFDLIDASSASSVSLVFALGAYKNCKPENYSRRFDHSIPSSHPPAVTSNVVVTSSPPIHDIHERLSIQGMRLLSLHKQRKQGCSEFRIFYQCACCFAWPGGPRRLKVTEHETSTRRKRFFAVASAGYSSSQQLRVRGTAKSIHCGESTIEHPSLLRDGSDQRFLPGASNLDGGRIQSLCEGCGRMRGIASW